MRRRPGPAPGRHARWPRCARARPAAAPADRRRRADVADHGAGGPATAGARRARGCPARPAAAAPGAQPDRPCPSAGRRPGRRAPPTRRSGRRADPATRPRRRTANAPPQAPYRTRPSSTSSRLRRRPRWRPSRTNSTTDAATSTSSAAAQPPPSPGAGSPSRSVHRASPPIGVRSEPRHPGPRGPRAPAHPGSDRRSRRVSTVDLEAFDQPAEVLAAEVSAPHRQHRPTQREVDHVELTALVEQVELDAPEGRRQDRPKIDHPRHRQACACPRRPSDRAGDQRLVRPDGEPHRDTRIVG